MRWRLLLQEYEITWKHIKGEDNNIADMLSRHPGVELEKKTQDYEPVKGSKLELSLIHI